MNISFSGDILIPSSVSVGYFNFNTNSVKQIDTFSASSYYLDGFGFMNHHTIINNDFEIFGQVLIFSFDGFEAYSNEMLPGPGLNAHINLDNVFTAKGNIIQVEYNRTGFNKWESVKVVPESSSCFLLLLTLFFVSLIRKTKNQKRQ